MEVARLDCPHCKRKLISRTSGWRYTLDPPLRTCPYCNGEYLMPCTYEWSIAGPLGKFFYCFLANGRCAPLPMILVEFANRNPKSALFWTTIWITICIFNLTVLDRKKIKSSYEVSVPQWRSRSLHKHNFAKKPNPDHSQCHSQKSHRPIMQMLSQWSQSIGGSYHP